MGKFYFIKKDPDKGVKVAAIFLNDKIVKDVDGQQVKALNIKFTTSIFKDGAYQDIGKGQDLLDIKSGDSLLAIPNTHRTKEKSPHYIVYFNQK